MSERGGGRPRDAAATRVFRLLLRLLPRSFRRDYADEMTELFRNRLARAREAGRVSVLRLWLRTTADLVGTAAAERTRPGRSAGHAGWLSWAGGLSRDLRMGIRSLRRRPLFAMVAGLSLAIGIGANTAIFSGVNTLLLQPIPGVERAQRVVELGRGQRGEGFDSFSYPDFVDIRDGVPALDEAAAYRLETLAFSRGGEGVRVNGMFASPAYFRVLGLAPSSGRFFAPEEDEGTGEHPVAVISYDFWRNRMGADPGVVGAAIQLNRQSYTVVGIGPQDFRGHILGYVPDVYLPMTQYPSMVDEQDYAQERRTVWHQAIGRLSPGSTVSELNLQLGSIAARLAEDHPETNRDRTFSALTLGPVPGGIRSPVSLFVGALMGLAVLILLVTCANVAGMFLARASARRREMTVRVALGAGRPVLVRQLTVEALLVFVLGGLAGVAFAMWGVRLIGPELFPTPVAVDFELALDRRVLAFAAAVTLATGLVFGLLPAVQATRLDLASSLREDTHAGGGRGLTRRVFVTAQLGFSLVLLVSAGLFLRSLQHASTMDAGFDPRDTYMTGLDLSLEGYSPEEGRIVQRALLDRVRALPQVTSAALANDLPLDLSSNGTVVRTPGQDGEDMRVSVDFNNVSPAYFETLRIPVLNGRDFAASDGVGAASVAIVSKTFVDRVWPAEDPLGRIFHWGTAENARALTVVGVVADVKNSMITDAPKPFVYLPLEQSYTAGADLVVRAEGGTAVLAPELRRTILEVDPGLSFTPVIALERYTGLGILPQRVAAGVTTALGLLALLLAGVGVYGVVAYGVGEQRREIGVRMALGAVRADILRRVLRDGLVLALPGAVVGSVLALGAGRVLQGLLLGLSPTDPVTLLLVAALLVATVLLASFVPARKAASVAPVEALRHD